MDVKCCVSRRLEVIWQARPERTELSQELDAVLPREHELFAIYVASGLSYRESARRAGFHEDNGFRLKKMPAIRA